jgi:hypothetical protein
VYPLWVHGHVANNEFVNLNLWDALGYSIVVEGRSTETATGAFGNSFSGIWGKVQDTSGQVNLYSNIAGGHPQSTQGEVAAQVLGATSWAFHNTYPAKGTYLACCNYGLKGGSAFINNPGTDAGGFQWFVTGSDGSVPSPIAWLDPAGNLTVAGNIRSNKTLGNVSSGAPASVVAEVKPAIYTGTAGIPPATLFTPTAAGILRACGFTNLLVPAAAGTSWLQVSFKSDGQAVTHPITPSGTSMANKGSMASDCFSFYSDASAPVQWSLVLSGTSRTPASLRYWITLEQM